MPLLFLAASSAALFFAHVVPHGYVFAIGGIALFLYSLGKEVAPRRALLYGLLLGTASALGALCWLWDTLPLSWLGIESQFQSIVIIFFSWSITALVLGVPVALWALLQSRVRPPRFMRALFAASTWVIGEYLGMWLVALLTIGTSYRPSAHFSLAMIGYTATDLPGALLLAPLGGVYTLSFFAVFIASLLSTCAPARRVTFVIVSCSLIVGIALNTHFEKVLSQTPAMIPFALVTTDFDPQIQTSETAQAEVRRRVAALVSTVEGSSIVVLPEGLRFLEVGVEASNLALSPKLLIDSSSDAVGVRRLELRIRHEDGRVDKGPRKQYLLPYGEYLPIVFRQVALFVIGGDGVSLIEERRTLVPGTTGAFGPIGEYALGVRFCSESMSPELFRSETRAGAEILINTANSSWFHRSLVLERKMISIARVRAAESARYLVVANNQGPSLAINPLGRVIARSHSPEEVVLVRVATSTSMTPYVQFGGWVLIVPLILVILTLIKISLARRKSDL